jgi:hypothetical protein
VPIGFGACHSPIKDENSGFAPCPSRDSDYLPAGDVDPEIPVASIRSGTKYWIAKVINVVRDAASEADTDFQNVIIKVVTAAARTPALTLAVGAQLFVFAGIAAMVRTRTDIVVLLSDRLERFQGQTRLCHLRLFMRKGNVSFQTSYHRRQAVLEGCVSSKLREAANSSN